MVWPHIHMHYTRMHRKTSTLQERNAGHGSVHYSRQVPSLPRLLTVAVCALQPLLDRCSHDSCSH